jgi:uncharacterized membrane protein
MRGRIVLDPDLNRREPERLEFFSDAVIAIAITLLVIEIHIPERPEIHSNRELWHALGELWPSYLGYLITFLGIGIMWVNHHRMFRYLERVDRYLILINTVFLLCIAFVPFVTGLLAEFLGHPGEGTAIVVYTGWFVVTGIIVDLLWRYPYRWRPELLDPEPGNAELEIYTRMLDIGTPAQVIALIFAVVYAPVSLLIVFGLAILYALPWNIEPREPAVSG